MIAELSTQGEGVDSKGKILLKCNQNRLICLQLSAGK